MNKNTEEKEVIATCESCEKKIYEGEEYHQDDGDCDFCDSCWKEWMKVIKNCNHKLDENTKGDEIEYCIKCSGQMPVKKERPILFSTPMVRAIVGISKKATRRIIKDKHILYMLDVNKCLPSYCAGLDFCPYGKVGDILWVRETFRPLIDCETGEFSRWDYKAGMPDDFYKQYPQKGFKPSIHMPKAAARIWLEITEIKIERLQDISEEDAIAEGVETLGLYPGYDVSCKGKFEGLWNSINGMESWEANPWVWVIKFKRIQK